MSATPITGFGAIEGAVRKAASATGIKFDFLMRTAKRESGFDTGAKAPTSSAAGLFQFVEQTWMATLKQHGGAHGYSDYADLIQKGGDGRYRVADDAARQAVLGLRYDAHASALMAGELASDHAAYLRGRVGREPTGGELYMAHFLGQQGSARLIEANEATPGAAAASLFPEAASANRSVFYRDGRPLTVAEVYTGLANTTGDGGVTAPRDALFASDAGSARDARKSAEAELIRMLLDQGNGMAGPAGSMFSAEMLSMLSQARKERDG